MFINLIKTSHKWNESFKGHKSDGQRTALYKRGYHTEFKAVHLVVSSAIPNRTSSAVEALMTLTVFVS